MSHGGTLRHGLSRSPGIWVLAAAGKLRSGGRDSRARWAGGSTSFSALGCSPSHPPTRRPSFSEILWEALHESSRAVEGKVRLGCRKSSSLFRHTCSSTPPGLPGWACVCQEPSSPGTQHPAGARPIPSKGLQKGPPTGESLRLHVFGTAPGVRIQAGAHPVLGEGLQEGPPAGGGQAAEGRLQLSHAVRPLGRLCRLQIPAAAAMQHHAAPTHGWDHPGRF